MEVVRKRAHTTRTNCSWLGKKRACKKFEGELPKDQRWLLEFEGKYAISNEGVPYRYQANGSCHELKTATRGKHVYFCPFVNDGKHWFRISDLIAQSFLGAQYYVFKDGDMANVRLDNIVPISAVMQPDEVPIDSFDGMYTIDSGGDIYSYTLHRRKKLKSCDSVGKSKRVCLTHKDGLQETFYVDKLIKKYIQIH